MLRGCQDTDENRDMCCVDAKTPMRREICAAWMLRHRCFADPAKLKQPCFFFLEITVQRKHRNVINRENKDFLHIL